MERISAYRDDPDPEMRRLTRWLIDTDANPYGFLMWSNAAAFDNAQGFARLLDVIHHALVDDGEISFVAVQGRPMIVFANRDEIGNVELRMSVEIERDERLGVGVRIEILDGIEAFITRQERRDAHLEERIRLRQALKDGQITQEEWRERWAASAAFAEGASSPA
jgi:hypothetical protein